MIYEITVVSPSEITATVSIRRRGRDLGATDCDLHVDSATLPDAFRVMP